MKQLLLFLVGLLTLSQNIIGQSFDTVISQEQAMDSFVRLSFIILIISFLVVTAVYWATINRDEKNVKDTIQVATPIQGQNVNSNEVMEEISAFDLSRNSHTEPSDDIPIAESTLVASIESIPVDYYPIKPEPSDYIPIAESPLVSPIESIPVDYPIEPEPSNGIPIAESPLVSPIESSLKKKVVRKKKSKPSVN